MKTIGLTKKHLALLSVVMLLSGCLTLKEESINDKAQRIHEGVLTLDTHVDINPKDFTRKRHLGMSLNTELDLPKMKQGGLDAAFFIVYVGQGDLSPEAYTKANLKAQLKFDAIHRMTETLNHDLIVLARTPEDVRAIHAGGKKVAMIGVENAYPLGTDINNLDGYFDQGARYISLVHNGHNQFGDSNYPKGNDPIAKHNGVTELGKQLIARANQLGVMVDISHASKKTALDTLKLSQAPVIASHSSVAMLHAHTRNVDDDVLLAIKRNNGVIHVVAFRSYLKPTAGKKLEAINVLAKKYKLPQGSFWEEGDRVFSAIKKLPAAQRLAYFNEFRQIVKMYDHASVKDLVDHIDYVVEKIGIEHVGISSDFGGGGGLTGWEDASKTLNVTAELIKRGYSNADIEKIWSGNLLRVWEDVISYANK